MTAPTNPSSTTPSPTLPATSTPRRMDARLRAALVTVVVSASVFAGVASFAWSLRAALSVAVGGAIATANLYVLARIVASLMPADDGAGATEPRVTGGTRAWGVLALFKMIALFGGVWMLMSHKLVDPMPMLVGFGALPIGIAIGSIVSDRTAKS